MSDYIQIITAVKNKQKKPNKNTQLTTPGAYSWAC